jgi:hypothetical protein
MLHKLSRDEAQNRCISIAQHIKRTGDKQFEVDEAIFTRNGCIVDVELPKQRFDMRLRLEPEENMSFIKEERLFFSLTTFYCKKDSTEYLPSTLIPGRSAEVADSVMTALKMVRDLALSEHGPLNLND